MKSAFLSRFTPSLMSAETLEAMFVKRHELAKDLVEVIRISATTANKHFRLLIGPRGIGKTHMMALIYHRVAKMEDLRDRLLIAWLREEEWGVTSFLDLLLRIFRAIAKEYPAEYDDLLKEKVEALYQLSADEAEYKAAALLREFVGKRVLLLLIENLDDLFDGLGDIGQKQFRAYIQNYSFLTIVATAQSPYGTRLQTYPFYGFFYNEELEELHLEEAIELLAYIAKLEGDRQLESFIQTATGFDRIRAIHHIAGGNPRLYVIFAQFLSLKSLDELVEPFMRTLDELTPYYQSKMVWLPQAQRKIVEFLVDRRSAFPVTEIAQCCFMSLETASSELKDLREKGYVNSDAIGRELFYELREPLMRFCLEMKKQRGEPIRLFVDFLRAWYTRTELQQLLGWQIERFRQKRKFDDLREGLSEAQMEELRSKKYYFNYQQPLEPLPADALMEREYVKRALESIEEAEEDPRVAACLEEYKQCCEKKDYISAVEYANKLVKIRGQAKDWLKQGDCLDDLNRKEEALESYDQASLLEPNNAIAWHKRGLMLSYLNRKEEALESFDKAIVLDPNYAYIWIFRAIVLDNLNRKGEALESYDQALALDSNNAIVWGLRGDLLDELNRKEEALESCNKAIALDPNDAITWDRRGNLLDELNRKEEALESYDQASALDPNSAIAWFNRGTVLDELNRKEEALESFDKAIKLNPNYAIAWSFRAIVLSNLNRKGEALESYDKAIALDPNDEIIWCRRGLVLSNLNRKDEALESYNQASAVNPNYAKAWFFRGVILSEFNRKEEALESYAQAIALDPNYVYTWRSRGDVLSNLKRYEEALESYDKAIELDPNYVYTWRSRGCVLFNLKRYEEALESYDKAIELDPDFSNAWSVRGLVLDSLKSYEGALKSYDKAIELDPNNSLAWFIRGWALVHLGYWNEALASCNQVIELNNKPNISYTEYFLRELFNLTQDAAIWHISIATIIKLCEKHKVVSEFSQGLVRSIPELMSEIVSDKAAQTWLEVWRESVGDVSEFVIPLRLLNAAVRYKETKGDKRVLLELPIEERNLLQPLLEIKEE